MPDQLLSTDPSAAVLLSSDPRAGMAASSVPEDPHQPQISAAAKGFSFGGREFPSAWPDVADPSEVTLGDLMENPQQALAQMGANLKRDVSDPRNWLNVALMYFGPKVFAKAAPTVARAASAAKAAPAAAVRGAVRGVAAAGDVVSPDVIGIVSPRAGKALEVAQRMRAAMPQASEPVAPAVEPVAPARANNLPDQKALNDAAIAARRAAYQAWIAAPAAAAPVAPEPPAAASVPATASPRPGTATPTPKIQLNAAEMKEFLRVVQKGQTETQALAHVLKARQLARILGGASDAEARATVQHRNETGRWD